jgi:hypothetical protein
MKYRYKTEPRGKQREVIEGTWRERTWALLCRPGTGKSKLNLDTAGFNYWDDRIDCFVVIAPEGVDRQWIEEAVPTHLSDDVPRVTGNYRSRMGKMAFDKLWRDLTTVPKPRKLVVVSFSFDGIQTPRGKKLVNELLKKYRCMVTVDESHRASNSKSSVFRALKPVVRAARVKRIATGTLVRQNPFSAYGQFELMGEALLGFASLASFKSMYAEMLPADDRLVRRVQMGMARRDASGRVVELRRDRQGNPIVPAIIAKDDDGRPRYRNLSDLRQRLARTSSFLTLADVNGAEPVVNEVPRYVTLTDAQRAVYSDLVRWGVAQAPGGQLTAEGALALSIRLAQVVGGFVPSDDDPMAQAVGDTNPKLQELLELADELCGEKLVVWCKFSAEIDAVSRALEERYGEDSVVQYHGRMNAAAKDCSKKSFITHPKVRFFVGQQKAGGTGLDGLQAVAWYMVFYSNDYPYLERLQAISRLARTGGSGTVQVWDIVAEQTIDEDIVQTLRTAQDVSESVLTRAIVREWD